MTRDALEHDTALLFDQLWEPYSHELFEKSVALFMRRLKAMGIPQDWMVGRRTLDAGCGGGRNTIAMARLGATADGIDIGHKGIRDAARRSIDLPNARFSHGSIESIPFPDETFDLVWCAGVLMIVHDEQRALDELARVLRHGGRLFLLVYATGGLRWPLIQLLRPIACTLSQVQIELAMDAINLPANKRRTFLDDLFCPKLEFYDWTRLERMLKARGFANITRLGRELRFDHEHTLADYRADLESLRSVFASGASAVNETQRQRALFEAGEQAIVAAIRTIEQFELAVARDEMSESAAMEFAVGQGHHRVLASKAPRVDRPLGHSTDSTGETR